MYAHIQDWSNDSPLMLHRQHHPDGNKEMQAQMALFFRLPNKWEKATQSMCYICPQAPSRLFTQAKPSRISMCNI